MPLIVVVAVAKISFIFRPPILQPCEGEGFPLPNILILESVGRSRRGEAPLIALRKIISQLAIEVFRNGNVFQNVGGEVGFIYRNPD